MHNHDYNDKDVDDKDDKDKASAFFSYLGIIMITTPKMMTIKMTKTNRVHSLVIYIIMITMTKIMTLKMIKTKPVHSLVT